MTEEVLEAPPAGIEDIALELPEPTTGKRAETIAAVVESSTGHGGECVVGARAESNEGSTACPSTELELLSPAESSFVEATTTSEVELAQELGFAANKTSSSTLSASDVEFPPQPVESIVTCYPLELLEELAAKISGRGEGEVVVEGVGVAVGVGAVEGVAGWVRGQTGWEAKGLVPTMCERRPGDLKALFLCNLVKVKEGHPIDCACTVCVAQMALEDLSQLEVVGPLGEGASGTVSAVCHSVVPGNFALKMVREVSLILARSTKGER